MKRYIHERDFNLDFVDLALLIIARLLKINLLILDTKHLGCVTKHLFESPTASTNTITLHHRRNHYNGITALMKDPYHPSMGLLTTNNEHQDISSLSHPWSLDPLLAVTPLLLPHLIDATTDDMSMVSNSDSVLSGEASC